jgi:hypothetical protein
MIRRLLPVAEIRIFGCGSLIRFLMIIPVILCWKDIHRMSSLWIGFLINLINL